MDDYTIAIENWYQDRLAALKAEDGWLHLTDRVEINPGMLRVGSAADNDVQISAGPAHLGTLVLAEDGSATFDAGQGPLAFQPFPDNPPRLKVANLLIEVTAVEGQSALRVRDLDLPARHAFAGIERYPVDPNWRVEAKWEALNTPQQLGIGMVTGVESSVQLTHRALFIHEGREITLLPTHWKSGKPMFVIRDATAGRETYGASRFLIGEVKEDHVVLDFNKAFNPPCAFTYFAVCPLPPRENIMPFEIRAGEKKPDFLAA